MTRRERAHRSGRLSEQPEYREGIEARTPMDIRRSVLSCNRWGWGREQTAKRCGITVEEVDEIVASRGQYKRAPRCDVGSHDGVTRRDTSLTPPGIFAVPHTDAWFAQNQESFVAGMRKLGMQPQETSNG